MDREILGFVELRFIAAIDEVPDDLQILHVLPGGKLGRGGGDQTALRIDHVGRQAASADFLQTAGLTMKAGRWLSGKRGVDGLNSAFHDNDIMLRVAGDTLALTPPLIVSEDQIGEIIEKTAKVIRAVA